MGEKKERKPLEQELVTEKIMLGGYDLAGELSKFSRKIKSLEESGCGKSELEKSEREIRDLKGRIEQLELFLSF